MICLHATMKPIAAKYFKLAAGKRGEQEIRNLLRASHACLLGKILKFYLTFSRHFYCKAMNEQGVWFIDICWYQYTSLILILGTLDKSGRQVIVVPHYKGESSELSAALSFITQLFRYSSNCFYVYEFNNIYVDINI